MNGELAISFCGSHSIGLGNGACQSCLTCTSFDAGNPPPWLSVTKRLLPGPQPMPCGVRGPPAVYSTSPVRPSTLMVVPRLGAGCGLVVVPP